jgi:hypothetical protein
MADKKAMMAALQDQAIQRQAESKMGEEQNAVCLALLKDDLEMLRRSKPNDRSEKDRRYAIVITELEKVVAYFAHWIVGQE